MTDKKEDALDVLIEAIKKKEQELDVKSKAMVINGVDVSGCHNVGTNGLTNHKIPYCREFTGNCKSYPHCYFKQCSRKDERIRELEEKNKSLRQFYKNLTMQGDHLSASQLDAVVTIGYSMGANTYVAENRELKQKLSQIAELADKIITQYDQTDCMVCDGGSTFAEEIKQIAQGDGCQ